MIGYEDEEFLDDTHLFEKWIKQYKFGHVKPADEELRIIRWYTPLGEVNQAIWAWSY